MLIKAATRLQAARDEMGAQPGIVTPQLDEALTYNRRLWTILVTGATDSASQLPREMKQNIGTLGAFILRRSMEMLTNPAPEQLAILITINRHIAMGLLGR